MVDRSIHNMSRDVRYVMPAVGKPFLRGTGLRPIINSSAAQATMSLAGTEEPDDFSPHA